MLIFGALQPARRYVVLASRRGLVRSWFFRKAFPQLVVFSARIQWVHSCCKQAGSLIDLTLACDFCAKIASPSIFYNRVRFDFDQPIGIDKTHNLHDRVGRADAAKKLPVDNANLFPVFYASQQNSSPYDV